MPPKNNQSGFMSVEQRSEIGDFSRHTPARSLVQPRNRSILATASRRTGTQSQHSPTRMTVETHEAVYWGTNIDERAIEKQFDRFLKEYRYGGMEYYMSQLNQLNETDQFILNIDGRHLLEFNNHLYQQLIHYPAEIIPIFDTVVQKVFYDDFLSLKARNEQEREEFRLYAQRLLIGIINLERNVQVRELNPKDINKLISVTGIVIRCSELYPDMKQATFKCTKCGHQVGVNIERGRVEEPISCQRCRDKNSYELIHNLCQFTDKQYVKLQEQPENVPEGYTPQTVNLVPYDYNVDDVKPGDRIIVVGVYRAAPIRQTKNRRVLKSIYNTFIDVISYQKETKIEQEKTKNITEEQKQKLMYLSQQPNIYDRLVKSIAPSIWEMDDVKKGVLCQLFGGTNKEFSQAGKGRFRADINVLLVGDPSTSKSQILQCVHQLSSRGIYTSGKGSSAVGLTVYVSRDPETREIILESGALVLSDMGICCIDEFDKMDENAKTILHEAMEQQTISVAKAGIVSQLNARTAVLAAANPLKSRYDVKQSVVQNINMPPTILSRFDLIYLVLDEFNEKRDEMLAYHILNMYSLKDQQDYLNQIEEEGNTDLIDRETLYSYICYAKQNIFPRLTEEAQNELIAAYVKMRSAGNSSNTITATPRQLESLIRLSEALAKMQFNQRVENYHVQEAVKLMETAMKKAALDPITGKIDMDLLATGRSNASRELVSKFIVEITNLIKANLSDYRGQGVRFFDFVEQINTIIQLINESFQILQLNCYLSIIIYIKKIILKSQFLYQFMNTQLNLLFILLQQPKQMNKLQLIRGSIKRKSQKPYIYLKNKVLSNYQVTETNQKLKLVLKLFNDLYYMDSPLKDMTGTIVNKQYKLIKKLGAGAFGEIYSSQSNGLEYAIKIEKSDSKHPQLEFESKLYHYLNNHNGQGIPKYYGYHQQDGYNFLVMELLGQSLEDIFSENNRIFTLQTVCVLGIQMLECIEFLHSKQFIHRDIKPDNFLMGKSQKDRVYLVDYGLAKRYISKDLHIPYKDNKALTGTARYASINTHLGIEQSRRDDLESLAYVLMYFLRGSLPWQNLRANNQKEKYDRIMEKKLATSSETLCKNYPQQLLQFVDYTKNLKFDEKPDYQFIKNLFIQIMQENELRMEYIYDWDDEDTQRDKIQIRNEEKTSLLKNNKQTSNTQQRINKHQENKNINSNSIYMRNCSNVNNKYSIGRTKTNSIGSINKIVVTKTKQITNNTINSLTNQNTLPNNNNNNNKLHQNLAKQIIKKHSSLHYQ